MRLKRDFFERDVLVVAPDLLGKVLVRRWADGREQRWVVREVEVYRGEEDQACHARFGRTERNRVMWERGGLVYVYLIYGMYWMLNIVTGKKGEAQAVLIRGLEGVEGPGRVGRAVGVERSFYGEDVVRSERLWIEAGERRGKIECKKRVGVEYAGEWAEKKWRFILKD